MNKELKEKIEKQLVKFHNKMIYSNHCHEDAIYLWIHSEENKQILRYVAEESAKNLLVCYESRINEEDNIMSVNIKPIFSEQWFNEFIGDEK